MGAGKTCCSLVADLALSGPTDGKRRWRRSLHHTESGTQEWGLGVDVWMGPRHPGQESGGLVLLVPGVQAGCMFSGHPLDTLIRESPGDPVRLVYGLAS